MLSGAEDAGSGAVPQRRLSVPSGSDAGGARGRQVASDNTPRPTSPGEQHQSPVGTKAGSTSRDFVKSLVAKGGGAREFTSPRFKHSTRFDPMPILPPDVDHRIITSHEDMGERASFHSSMYHTVRTSPHRYGVAFKSKCNRFGDDKGSFMRLTSWPGFLEHQETPRSHPSIEHALNRPATSFNGAENERTYNSTFKTQYEWPKNIARPINGGGIHALLDRKTNSDKYGQILVYEKSIADEMKRTPHTYHSTFKARHKDHTIHKEPKQDFRSTEYERAHPTNIARKQEASSMNYSAMTQKSSKERFTLTKYATDNIRDWYDIGHSSSPDISVAVERSPIKYSAFHATTTHPHNIGKDISASQLPMTVSFPDVKDPSDASLGSTKRIMGAVWDRSSRFLPDGHALSMIPPRVCNNELQDTTAGTIARAIETSPIRVKTMSSATRRTSEVDLCYNPRPGSMLFVTRSKTEWYDGACKALPDGRMPIADRVATTPQTYISSLQSQTLRSAIPPSMDPRQTLEHERRRQHILESRIQAMREGGKETLSPKMKKILNMEPALEFERSAQTREEEHAMALQHTRELHSWLQGPAPGTPARARSVSSTGLASTSRMVSRSPSLDTWKPSKAATSEATTSKAGVSEERVRKSGVGEERTNKLSVG